MLNHKRINDRGCRFLSLRLLKYWLCKLSELNMLLLGIMLMKKVAFSYQISTV